MRKKKEFQPDANHPLFAVLECEEDFYASDYKFLDEYQRMLMVYGKDSEIFRAWLKWRKDYGKQ